MTDYSKPRYALMHVTEETLDEYVAMMRQMLPRLDGDVRLAYEREIANVARQRLARQQLKEKTN